MPSEPRYLFARRLALTELAELSLARRSKTKEPDRLVVIRTPLPHLRDEPGFIDAFVARAKEAAGLRHPNVVEILAVLDGQAECGIVMEYLSGASLDRLLLCAEQGLVIPIGVACRIISDAAAGVHAAHRREPLLVHPDFHPASVLVTYHGSVKVGGFGVAPPTPRTRYGYVAPEIFNEQPPDPRSDVYSLGVVLWELLAGRRLFGGASSEEVTRAVLEADVVAPSHYNRAVPLELDALVLSSIRREPDDRTNSADRLQADLDALLESFHLNVRNTQVGNWLSTVLADQSDERRNVEAEIMLAVEPPAPRPAEPLEEWSEPKRAARSLSILAVVGVIALLLACAVALIYRLARF